MTTSSERRSIDRLLNSAMQAISTGRQQEAVALYHDVLSRDGRNVTALINLGALNFQMGDLAQALPLMRQAFELAPDHPGTHTNLMAAHESSASLANMRRIQCRLQSSASCESPRYRSRR